MTIHASDIDARRSAIGPLALHKRWRNCERRGHYIVLVSERPVCLHCLVTFVDGIPVDSPDSSIQTSRSRSGDPDSPSDEQDV